MQYKERAEELKRSHWPKCDALAESLAAFGPPAGDALEDATKSRTHHVRSAALRALAKVDSARGKSVAERLLSDKAYEVRETAASILGVPTPG